MDAPQSGSRLKRPLWVNVHRILSNFLAAAIGLTQLILKFAEINTKMKKHMEGFQVIGLFVRATNEEGMAAKDIPALLFGYLLSYALKLSVSR